MKKINFNHLIKVVSWITTSFKPNNGSVSLQALIVLLKHLEKIQSSRGPIGLIDYCKVLRGNLMNYLSSNSERIAGVRLTKDGIPIILGDLIPVIRGKSYLAIAMIFTVLFSTRSLNLGTKPEVTSIIQPTNGEVPNLVYYMFSFWKELGYLKASTIPSYLNVNTKMIRSKAGPNGHALTTSYLDIKNLPETLIQSLKTMGGRIMENHINLTRNDRMRNFWVKHLSLTKKDDISLSYRKLSYFSDKEYKVRVIGIMDWFSQLALKPLHLYLARVLKRIPQDCTHDQSNFLNSLKNSETYYSIDLSNATDRFPIEMIFNLLNCRFPETYVKAWKDVMVGYPFDFKIGRKVEKLFYSVGNPMGAYSSFNSFALTHHFIIYYLCKKHGKNWKTLPYALLGDDIVIGDKVIGEAYMSFLSLIDVKFSLQKTHRSDNFYEFAKRLFYNNVEVTPFPISALSQCRKSPEMMTTLLWEENRKGKWVHKEDLVSSVSSFFLIVMNWRRPYINKKVSINSWLIGSMLNVLHGLTPADVFINEIIRKWKLRMKPYNLVTSNNLVATSLMTSFVKTDFSSAVKFTIKDIPLYGYVLNLNKLFMKEQFEAMNEDPDFDGQLLSFQNTPIPQAQEAVYKEYNDLSSYLSSLDKSTFIDWSSKLRRFSLPKFDKSILEKGNVQITRQVKTLGNKIVDQLKINEVFKPAKLFFGLKNAQKIQHSVLRGKIGPPKA